MTRRQFLTTLDSCLAGKLPANELQDLLNYYDEYFEEAGIEHEEETAAALGDPRALAAQVLAEQMLSSTTESAPLYDTAPAVEPEPSRPRRSKPLLYAVLAVVLLLLVIGSSIFALIRRLDTPTDPSNLLTLDRDHTAVVETIDETHERYTLRAMEELSIELTWGDITLEHGDQLAIDLNWGRSEDELRCEYVSGVCTVRPRFHNVSSTASGEVPEVRVTIPTDARLNSIRLSTEAGTIRLSNIEAEAITLRSSAGAVNLYRCGAGSLSASVALGDLNADALTADLFEASLSSGNATLNQCDIENGSISVQMGSVELKNWKSLLLHKELELQTFMGSILYNGNDRGSSFDFKSSGTRVLSVQCSMGSITLDTLD